MKGSDALRPSPEVNTDAEAADSAHSPVVGKSWQAGAGLLVRAIQPASLQESLLKLETESDSSFSAFFSAIAMSELNLELFANAAR